MIDFHSHILPGIDDGSKSIEESIALLQKLYEQGVDCVCATPHFYTNLSIPRHFCDKREEVYLRLASQLNPNIPVPKIILGAEVTYFPGICKSSEIEMLKFKESNILLLEMPFVTWSDYTVQELLELSVSCKCRVVLAHIERYMNKQSKRTLNALLDAGVLFQVNASFFINRRTRRKALKMLRRGDLQLLGTDCHNISSRPPRFDEAISIITKKLGEEFVADMLAFGESILYAKKF